MTRKGKAWTDGDMAYWHLPSLWKISLFVLNWNDTKVIRRLPWYLSNDGLVSITRADDTPSTRSSIN